MKRILLDTSGQAEENAYALECKQERKLEQGQQRIAVKLMVRIVEKPEIKWHRSGTSPPPFFIWLRHRTKYEYDAAGRLTSTIDPEDRVTSYHYDDLGRQDAVILYPDLSTETIVDNGDTSGWSVSGDWDSEPSADPAYGDDYHYISTGNDTDTATWSFTGLDNAKQYEVLVTWVAASANATNAPFSVTGANSINVTVDQTRDVAHAGNVRQFDDHLWTSLGLISPSSGDLSVVLNADAVCIIEAFAGSTYVYNDDGSVQSTTDALGRTTTYTYDNLGRQTTVTAPYPDPEPTDYTYVIDNEDGATDYVEASPDTGDWSTQTTPPGYGPTNADYRIHPVGSDQNTAKWTFDDLTVGQQYEVLATWPADADHAYDTPYTVDYDGVGAGGDGDTVLVDQTVDLSTAADSVRLKSHDWYSLGVYTAADATFEIKLTADATAYADRTTYVAADAVYVVPARPQSTTAYNLDGSVASVADAAGHATSFDYDDLGRLVTQTDALTGETTYTYDALGNQLTLTDPINNTTAWTYDNLGRVESEMIYHSDALVGEWLLNESFGTDPNEIVPDLSGRGYDGTTQGDAKIANGVLEVDGVSAIEISVADDSPLKLLNSNLTISLRFYLNDALPVGSDHILAKRTGGNLDYAIKVYSSGELAFLTNQEGGDLKADTEAGVVTFGRWYDLVITHDTTSELVGIYLDGENIVRPANNTAEPINTADSNLYIGARQGPSIGIDGKISDVRIYNEALTADQLAILGRRRFEYDAAGRLARRIDRMGRVRAFEYDVLGRLTEEVWYDSIDDAGAGTPKVNTLSYTYNDDGSMASASDTAFTFGYLYEYDALGRVDEIKHYLAGLVASTSPAPDVRSTYAYDGSGLRTLDYTVFGGKYDFYNSYTYDDLGRLDDQTQATHTGPFVHAVAEKRIDYTYDAAGGFDTITRYMDTDGAGGNKVVTSDYDFDAAARLIDLVHTIPDNPFVGGDPSPVDVVDYDWLHDAAGRMLGMEIDATDPDSSVTLTDTSADYAHDATNQLTDAVYSSGPSNEDYDYDANGNRDTGYTTGLHNRLEEDGTYNYLNDAEGNRTARFEDEDNDDVLHSGDINVTVYEWDHRNRLTAVKDYASYTTYQSDTPTQVVEYFYDHANRWIRKTVAESTDSNTVFIYDGNQIVLHFEDTGSGDLTAADLEHRYFWGAGSDQLMVDESVTSLSSAGTRHWTLGDHLGSIRDVIKDNGDMELHRLFTAYGQASIAQGDPNDYPPLFSFTGRPFDEDTLLQNNLNRWYDALVGRWLKEDPIGFAAGDANPYRYVANSPLNHVDLTGLWKIVRNGGVRATATAAKDDTIVDLAAIIGLDAREHGEWLTVTGKFVRTQGNPAGPVTKVEAKIFLEYPMQRNEKICAGEKFEIPNEIMMLWFGDVGFRGRNAVGWDKNKQKLEGLGFRVFMHINDFDPNDPKQGNEWSNPTSLTQLVAAKSAAKELHGFFIVGYGSPTGFRNSPQPPRQTGGRKPLGNQGRKNFGVTYSAIKAEMNYLLGVGIMAVCHGGHSGASESPPTVGGRDLFSSSPGVVFHGEDRNYYPIAWDNINLDEFFAGGKQGTKE